MEGRSYCRGVDSCLISPQPLSSLPHITSWFGWPLVGRGGYFWMARDHEDGAEMGERLTMFTLKRFYTRQGPNLLKLGSMS